MNFGEMIKDLRLKKHYSQRELAEKLNISQQAYAKYEKTIETPKYATCQKIAHALDCDINEILFIGSPWKLEEKEIDGFYKAKKKYGDDLDSLQTNKNKKTEAAAAFLNYTRKYKDENFDKETLIDYLDNYIYFDYLYYLWIHNFNDFQIENDFQEDPYDRYYGDMIENITKDDKYPYEIRKTIRDRFQLPELTDKYLSKGNKFVVRVLGRVAAGIPIEMSEDIIGEENITQELARKGELFGLKISGNSMEPEIHDGDVVIVKQQEDVESGEIAIVTINGDDATCKRFIKYADGISLVSINPTYAPMYFSDQECQEKPIRIIGKVMETRHKYY